MFMSELRCALCGERTPLEGLVSVSTEERTSIYFHRECHPSDLERLRKRSDGQARRTLAALEQRGARRRHDPGLAPMSRARLEQIDRARRADQPPPPAEAAFWVDATWLHARAPDDTTLRAWLKSKRFPVEYLHALATVARVGPIGQGTLCFPPKAAWVTTPISSKRARPNPSRRAIGLGVTEAQAAQPEAKGQRRGLGVTEAPPKAPEKGKDRGLGVTEAPRRLSRRIVVGATQFLLRWIKGRPYAYRRDYVGAAAHARPKFRDIYLGRIEDDVATGPEAELRAEIDLLSRRAARATKRPRARRGNPTRAPR
jgi:hypothetical protein